MLSNFSKQFVSKSLSKYALSLQSLQLIQQQNRKFITVIKQTQVGYREFLGTNRVRLEPGLRLNLPILHTLKRVNIAEGCLDVSELIAYTKDNVPVIVSGSLFYKVVDPEKACFSVQNYLESMFAVGQSAARSIIGKFEFDEITQDRNQINQELVNVIGKTIDEWGLVATRIELQRCEPANVEVKKQLEKQMEAERHRRENDLNTSAKIRTAEGEKEASIRKSEGAAIAVKNAAEAKAFEISTQAEGDRLRIEKETRAMTNQLSELCKLFNNDVEKASKYLLEIQRLQHLSNLANSPNRVYVMDPKNMFPISIMKDDQIVKN